MKKSFAKYIALFLAMTVALGTAGCGKDKAEQQEENAVVSEEGTDKEAETAEGEEKAVAKDALQTAFVQADGAPSVAASAAILIEASTGTILYEKDADKKMYPASMTKMLTAMVALDYFEPEELIKVGSEINEVSLDSSKAGHQVGEMLTIKNAIRGLIIPSGNDSANVVAAAVARRAENDDSLGFTKCEAVFTELMNKKAEELGATSSHFANAHGYHAEDHYTTGHDMALLARAFMENETLAEIANEKSFFGNGADNMFDSNENIKTQEYAWTSHNLLITSGEYNYAYATGIKTGFTDEAGDCVAAAAEKDGVQLIAVIFNSEDPGRWEDAKNLFEYGFNHYQKTEIAKANVAIEEVPLTKHKKSEGDTLAVVFQEDLVTFLPASAADSLKATVTYNDIYAVTDKEGNVSLKAPIDKGTEIGTVSYEVNGKTVLEAPVYAGRDVSKGNILSFIGYFFKNLFTLKGILTLVGIVAVVAIVVIIIKIISNRRNRCRGGYSFGSGLSMGGSRRRMKAPRRRRGGRRRF
ncbi:D-alanyl-D-alanine carboxypeptidase family protein [Anaerotignum sp.]|nr:D-alanyl-D-alanine carboxypeptidase family protein [Anaerotignum sp.]MBQ7757835.1 D-alanyl-D-alanine carboxypeptidase [Anaerotignum sp.]